MRDRIKNNMYFDNYIKYVNEDIEEFEGVLAEIITQKGELFEGVEIGYATLEMLYLDKIKALYSHGSNIVEIKKIYERFLECFTQVWTTDNGYERLLNAISLAVLLNIDKVQFEEAFRFLKKEDINDSIIDTLLNKIDSSWLIRDNEVRYPMRYELLDNIIRLDDKLKQQELLKQYLDSWYRKHNDAAWYDSHKSNQDTYNGYWCFEAGAVAKILGLDDIKLKDKQYYPYDMVHFRD